MAALILGLIAAGLLLASAGRSLGLYIGALGLAAIGSHYLALLGMDSCLPGVGRATYGRLLGRHQLSLLFVAGMGLVWLFTGPATELDAIRCSLVVWALCILLVELAATLSDVLHSQVLGGGITACLGVLWLTCPIWMSHLFQTPGGQKLANLLVAVHPLLVMNGVVAFLGVWPEQSVAYHLTNLGQDVSYALPTVIWWGVLFHVILALPLVAFNIWAGRTNNEGQP